jgi:hypothetical protein
MWRCLWLPWHRLKVVKRVSRDSDHVRCSCGREYGMNHHVRAFVPWSDVASFYD